MLYFKIGFENGDSFETGFNGTLEEAKAYYLGRVFNLGAVDDDMQRCNSVEQLPTLEMALAAWIASAGLVVLTDGTVSRRVSSVLVDDADLRLVVDGWQNSIRGQINRRFTCLWWMPTTWTDGMLTTTAKPFLLRLMV